MTANALFAMALTCALLGAAAICWAFVSEVQIAGVLALLALATIIGTVTFVPIVLLQRELRFDWIVRVNICCAIVVAATTLIAAFAGWRALSFAIGSLIGSVATSLIYLILEWRRMVFRPSFVHFRAIAVFGTQMMSISGVGQLAARASDMILGWSLGYAALGLYGRASNLSNMMFANIYGAATNVVFARMSREMRQTGDIGPIFLRAIAIITGFMWPLIVGVAILSGPIVRTLYGPQWTAAALPLSILMLSQFIVLGFGMNWEVFVLKGETALQTRYEAARAIVGTAVFAAGAMVSIPLAAAGRVVESILGYTLYRPHMDRLVGARPGQIEHVYGESLILTAAAAWPSLALMWWTGWDPRTPLLAIGAAVILGGLCWIVALWTRSHPLYDEITRMKTPARATLVAIFRRIPARVRWLRAPTATALEFCYFVTVAKRGQIAPHALYHARAWSDAGFAVVLIVVSDTIALRDIPDTDFAAGILLRHNRGYDFRAWADAIRLTRTVLEQAELLIVANDSVLGPFDSFGETVARIRASTADLVGLTKSFEIRPHLQSYLLAFKRKALRSDVFRDFWGSIQTGDRHFVIENYELPLTARFEQAGLSTEALFAFDADDHRNPTLWRWRDLIEQGFPYLKTSVLRDNLAGDDPLAWRFIADHGYDLTVVENYSKNLGKKSSTRPYE